VQLGVGELAKERLVIAQLEASCSLTAKASAPPVP
jgi:hypothetical protein